MTRCGTYRMPDLQLNEEEEINILIRTVKNIEPLLKKFEKLTEDNLNYCQDAFNQREYYKDRYEHFYEKLHMKLDRNDEKIKEVLTRPCR
jgi:hypothetical protein